MHVLCPLFQLYKSLPPSSLRAMADVTIVQELVSHDPLGFIHFLLLSYVLPLQPPHPEYEAPNSESLHGFFLMPGTVFLQGVILYHCTFFIPWPL